MVNAKQTKQLTVEFSQFLCDSSEHGGKIIQYFIKFLVFPLFAKSNSLFKENGAVISKPALRRS